MVVFFKVFFSLIILIFSCVIIYALVTGRGSAENVSILKRILIIVAVAILLLASLSVLVTTLFL